MLYFNRSDVTKAIHIEKTSASKERDIYQCWCFFDKRFKFQPHVCNKCHVY